MQNEAVQAKKPYEKPTLHVIDLAADEVLGIGCKSSRGGKAAGYTGCGLANGCAKTGS
jgi:hypothetical protein